MASAHRLDSLPLELREKIVSLGSYETLLQLSRTNRALHQACSSTHVVKAILHNHNGCGGQKWRYPRLLMDDPVSEWARYALADLKANEAGSNGGRVAPYSRAMLWAPQLMALQRSLVGNLEMTGLRLIKHRSIHFHND